MYDTVLVPIDSIEGMAPVVERAADIAATFDASLHLLHVVDTTALPDAAEGVYAELEPAGREAIEEAILVAENVGADTIESALARGPPAAVILDYIDERGVDLVVMGTHGREGVERVLLGSVTEKVVRASPVPVLTVSLGEAEWTAEEV